MAGERDDEWCERLCLDVEAADDGERDAEWVAGGRGHRVHVHLRCVVVRDDPPRERDERRPDVDDVPEGGEADEEGDGGGGDAGPAALLGQGVVVVLGAPVEIDVAVLEVGGVEAEEHGGRVEGGDGKREATGEHAPEPRRGDGRQHEHGVDLGGVRAERRQGTGAVTHDSHGVG